MRSIRRACAALALATLALAPAGCGGDDDGDDDVGPDAGPGPLPWTDPDPTGSERILGFDVLLELEILISDDGIARLRNEPRTYVEGQLVFEGETYGPVGVRLKGMNSFLPIDEKPSLRININEYHPDATFFGLKDMTLNNMSSDTSMMHERLAYKIARDAGVAASRANHALVTVNGELRGLYTNVETVKPRMLKGWFEDNNGSLFGLPDVDFRPQYVEAFEWREGPDDRTLIQGAVDALAVANADAAIASVGDFIDMEGFLNFWAVEALIAQFDALPYSMPGDDCFLYADPTSGKLWFIPWGMDETFLSALLSPTDITSSILAARCKESPACNQAFVDRVWALQTMTEDAGLEELRARIQDDLAPHVAADPRRPYTDAEVTEGQAQLGYFIRGRRETLGMFLPPPSPGP